MPVPCVHAIKVYDAWRVCVRTLDMYTMYSGPASAAAARTELTCSYLPCRAMRVRVGGKCTCCKRM